MFEKETGISCLRINVGYVQPGQRGKITNKRRLFLDIVEDLKNAQQIRNTTLGQYLRLPLDDQNRIKDVGSIVLGSFKDGRRKNENLESRSGIALDVDELTADQFERIMNGDTPLSRWVFFGHTTLKHSAEGPRMRIYIPLARDVEPSEYMPLSRIVASYLFDDEEESMDACDNVSFRPAQVAYLPAQLKGSRYEWIDNREAQICDPDEVFADFDGDWMDIAQLPVSEKRGHGVLARAKKAEDPWKKPGIIGAFCRAYPVDKAIDAFLPGVYIPSEEHYGGKPRYTFAKGSGTNGVVVEDDGRFIYSHHSTDPCGERLVNSWDMVRMHLYGEQDENIGEDVTASKRPSFKSMVALAEDAREVRVEMARASLDFDDISEEADREDDGRRVLKKEPVKAVAHYRPGADAEADPIQDGEVDLDVLGRQADIPIGSEDIDKEWQSALDIDKTGAINQTHYNAKLIVRNDPRLKNALAYNELTRAPVLVRSFSGGFPGASRFALRDAENGDPWQDVHTFEVAAMLSAPAGKSFRGYDISFAGGTILGAVIAAAQLRSFHPVRQDLAKCWEEWKASDRAQRAETMFIDYLGCEDNAFTREASLKFLLGMVARTFEPGCKHDYMPVLQGPQGSRKTTFLSILAKPCWHTEMSCDLSDPKVFIEGSKGFSLVELGELSSVRKSEVEDLKKAISATHDTARAAYARFPETVPRTCVFAGTTNAETYLRDPSGNRRFWIILVTKTEQDPIDTDRLARERNLIMGEVVDLYLRLRARGPVRTDLSPEASRIAHGLTQDAMESAPEDLIVDRIVGYLEQEQRLSLVAGTDRSTDYDNLDDPEASVVRTRATMGEIYQALFGNYSNPTTPSSNTMAAALRKIPGWVRFNKWVSPDGQSGSSTGKFRLNGSPTVVYVREDATFEEIKTGYRPARIEWNDGGESLI